MSPLPVARKRDPFPQFRDLFHSVHSVCFSYLNYLFRSLTSFRQHAMVQTRAQERGAPLKKEGAYNTDAYYQELDQGFGDVGVDQVRKCKCQLQGQACQAFAPLAAGLHCRCPQYPSSNTLLYVPAPLRIAGWSHALHAMHCRLLMPCEPSQQWTRQPWLQGCITMAALLCRPLSAYTGARCCAHPG
jgi:hypothetical protein